MQKFCILVRPGPAVYRALLVVVPVMLGFLDSVPALGGDTYDRLCLGPFDNYHKRVWDTDR